MFAGKFFVCFKVNKELLKYIEKRKDLSKLDVTAILIYIIRGIVKGSRRVSE